MVDQSAWAKGEGALHTATRGRRGRSLGSLPATVSFASTGGCPCHARCLGHSQMRAIRGCGHFALSVVSPGWCQRQGIWRGPGQHSAWPSGTPRRHTRVSRFHHQSGLQAGCRSSNLRSSRATVTSRACHKGGRMGSSSARQLERGWALWWQDHQLPTTRIQSCHSVGSKAGRWPCGSSPGVNEAFDTVRQASRRLARMGFPGPVYQHPAPWPRTCADVALAVSLGALLPLGGASERLVAVGTGQVLCRLGFLHRGSVA